MKIERMIVANWKMNPETPEAAREIFQATKRVGLKLKRTETVICPPAIYFSNLAKLAGGKVKIGAQNSYFENVGSYTGEISASMIRNLGGTHVILGHSERREMGETSEVINKKVLRALGEELTVILCIGEKARDSQGEYLAFLKQQLGTALSGIQKKFVENLVIAYEPVWAIGKSDQEAMKGADMYEMFIYIKKILTEMLGRDYAETIPVLYGGSVSALNAQDILVNGRVNGLLVGRQGLDPLQFKEILLIADSLKTSALK